MGLPNMFTTGLTFFIKKVLSIIVPSQIKLLLLGNTTTDGSQSHQSIANIRGVTVNPTITKFGQGSLQFDGATNYLQSVGSDDYNFGTNPFTVECYIYVTGNSLPAGGATHGTLLSSYNVTGWIFLVQGDATTTGTGLIVQVNSSQFAWPYPISQNAWHHVVWMGDGTNMYFGADGTLSSPIPYGNVTNVNSYGSLNIGALLWTIYDRYYNGNIEQLRITKGKMLYSGTTYTPPAQLNDYSMFV